MSQQCVSTLLYIKLLCHIRLTPVMSRPLCRLPTFPFLFVHLLSLAELCWPCQRLLRYHRTIWVFASWPRDYKTWMLEMDYVILLWHSLSLPYNYFVYSTLMSMEFKLFINTGITQINGNFRFKSPKPVRNVKMQQLLAL